MMHILIGIFLIFGSFILGWVIAPIWVMYSVTTAAILYGISWALFGIGITIGGHVCYCYTLKIIKKYIKR